VQTQKVPFGVDPKTVLCQFFKSGQCQKGDKCKFSHDLAVERKSAKIDLYTDTRTVGDKKTGMLCKGEREKGSLGFSLTIDLLYRYNGYVGSEKVGASCNIKTEFQNYHRHCVQVFLRSDRESEIWLVLGVS